MPGKLTREKRDAIAAAIRAGESNVAITARHGISEKSIAVVTREYGLLGVRSRGKGPMRSAVVHAGQRFGRLVVTEAELPGVSPARAMCACDCGAAKDVRVSNLLASSVRSCGCLHRELSSERGRSPEAAQRLAAISRSPVAQAAKSAAMSRPEERARRASPEYRAKLSRPVHGLTDHPLYPRWGDMMHRCTDPAVASYADYGARGISVEPWLRDVRNYVSYLEAGLALPGGGTASDLPEDERLKVYRLLTIDRIDNDGNYERGNLRWATRAEQAANRSRAS